MSETATATTNKNTGAPAATLDLSSEATGRAVPVFEGVWLIATKHRPHGGTLVAPQCA